MVALRLFGRCPSDSMGWLTIGVVGGVLPSKHSKIQQIGSSPRGFSNRSIIEDFEGCTYQERQITIGIENDQLVVVSDADQSVDISVGEALYQICLARSDHPLRVLKQAGFDPYKAFCTYLLEDQRRLSSLGLKVVEYMIEEGWLQKGGIGSKLAQLDDSVASALLPCYLSGSLALDQHERRALALDLLQQGRTKTFQLLLKADPSIGLLIRQAAQTLAGAIEIQQILAIAQCLAFSGIGGQIVDQ